MEKWHTQLPNSLVGVDASQEAEGMSGLAGKILASLSTSTAYPGRGLLAAPCTVAKAAAGLAALLASGWAQGPLACALGLSMLVKVLSRQTDAPPACFIYHNEGYTEGREGRLLSIQEFRKHGAPMFLVVGKPQNVGWAEGMHR